MNNWTNKKTNEEILELNRQERLGKTGISKYGFPMKIIEYRNAEDIDVDIDGVIVQHKKYKHFKSGNITKTNNDLQFTRIGETMTNSDGCIGTIIAYRLTNDIDIQFNDGTILKHKNYYSFKKGLYKNPNYKKSEPVKVVKTKPSKVGETIIANNGQKMTIISYRSYKDIDVQFEDGTIITNRRYQHFKNGEINNPNCMTMSNNIIKNDRVGETLVNADGIRMTIIDYRNRDDIDIQLDDGSILYHKSYENFKKGIKCLDYHKKNKIGETIINNNGLKMTITAYRKATDIDVEFEDGYIVKNIRYSKFKQANVRHPMPYMLKDIQIESKAYNYQNEMNFFYICTKCHYHDIGTIKEIQHHICKEN